MQLSDFMCKNSECERFEKRFSRGFPTESMKKRFMPVCDSCKQTCEEVEPILTEREPAGIAIKGDFGTPVRGNKGFAKGLTSKDPADLKRDLDSGNLFH